jgi:hypothetical protein
VARSARSRARTATSIPKFIERKWNIGALTYRDANADDLFDCLDVRRPGFVEPPTLPVPALGAPMPPACTPGDPGGPIPPPSALSPSRLAEIARARALARPAEAEIPMGEPLAEVWAQIAPHPDEPPR